MSITDFRRRNEVALVAGHALHGILANPTLLSSLCDQGTAQQQFAPVLSTKAKERVAQLAVSFANAVITAMDNDDRVAACGKMRL